MRGHHHALRGLADRTPRRRRDRRPACGLKSLRDFGAEDRVPRKIIAAGEIDHQRDIAVRHRRQPEFPLEPRQRRRHVRPSIEPVPDQRQIVEHLVGQILQIRSAAAGVRDCAGAARRAWRRAAGRSALPPCRAGIRRARRRQRPANRAYTRGGRGFFRLPGRPTCASPPWYPNTSKNRAADRCWEAFTRRLSGTRSGRFQGAATVAKSLIKWRERRELEPAASAVTGQRSNQLSYAPAGVGSSYRRPYPKSR